MRYWRKAWRDVRAMRSRAVLLLLVIGAGIGTAAGIALALHDVRATRDGFYRDYRLADLDIRLSAAVPAGELFARASAARATRATARLILDGGALPPSGGPAAAELVGMDPAAPLDQLAMLRGRPLAPGDPSGAVVVSEYASHARLRTGDPLRVSVAGRVLTLHVRGIARSPEYLLATANPAYLIPQPGSLAVIFLPRAGLQALAGLPGQVNDLAVDLPGGGAGAGNRQLASGLPVTAITPRDQQFSYRFTNADIRSFALFAPVLGGVFAAVGFLLLALSLRRLVHAQRRELGALLALGYPRRAVIITAVLPAAFLGAGGAVVAAAAAVGVAQLVATEYAAAVGFPAITHTYDPVFLLEAAGAALVTALLAALIPAVSLARLRPSAAMRGDAPPAFTLPAALRRITARGGLPLVYASRTLLRRPVPTAATSLSLAAAIGLGAALAVLSTSVSHAIDATFTGQAWSYTADLARPLPTGQARLLAAGAGALAAEPVTQGPAQLAATGHRADAQLTGLSAATPLQRLRIVAGQPPAPGRIVLSEQLASQLAVSTGDTITITTSRASRQKLTVGGIARTLASQQAFLPQPQAGTLLGLSGQATSLYVTGDASVASRLRASPAVARVTSKAAALTSMHQLVSELTGLITILLAISLGVGALFLVSSLALSYLDREGEFATLRALGYGPGHVTGVVASESLTQTLVAAALSIPAAILIAWPLAQRIGSAWFQISLAPVPGDFALAIGGAIGLAMLAIAHATRQIMRASIPAAVRSRLIG